MIKKITHTEHGHMIHHNSVFSMDGNWIVFDGRNDETKIGSTELIGIVDVHTHEERIIYKSPNQTIYGPGVGAASFSPTENRVVFIHGLSDADETKPYAISRRFGMAVDIDNPYIGMHMDPRDVYPPFKLGALRGGTHSHCWNFDGSMLSFTYNDEFIDEDLRKVGVMLPIDSSIKTERLQGNNSGSKYAVVITEVVRNPVAGTDQISKAFDECWLGKSNTIVFQGITRDPNGNEVIEIYKVTVDKQHIFEDLNTNGNIYTTPLVPNGIGQERVSRSTIGLSDFRHWLRSSVDGKTVYALAKDKCDRNQVVACDLSTGSLNFISNLDISISSPINIDITGDKLTFIAQNNIYLLNLKDGNVIKLTDFDYNKLKLLGAPVFSPTDNIIAFNAIEYSVPFSHIYTVSF